MATPATAAAPLSDATPLRLTLDGYYRIRWQRIDNPDLDGSGNAAGVKHLSFIQHRLRLMPTLHLDRFVRLHLDAIVGAGVQGCSNEFRSARPAPCDGIFGANGVTVLDTQLSDSMSNITLLRFWGEVTTPVGVIRAGRMPSHWGLGLLSNDGLHERYFGDAQFGDTFDRLLFATKPGGPDSNIITALAYDLISEGTPIFALSGGPPQIQRSRDNVHQLTAVLLYRTKQLEAGVYQVWRGQHQPQTNLGISDVYVRADYGLAWLATEVVFVYGNSRGLPQLDRQAGVVGLAAVDVDQRGWATEVGARGETWDAILAFGGARGDGNDLDDSKSTGFRFRADYGVGLIMFDYAVANLTERRVQALLTQLNALRDSGVLALSDTEIAQLSAVADLARTQGGVANARYINPIGLWRPIDNLTLKGGLLWARSDSAINVIDFAGVRKRSRDLGVEFDGGVEYTFRKHFTVSAETGVLLPGGAFDRPRTMIDETSGFVVPVDTRVVAADPAWLLTTGVNWHF